MYLLTARNDESEILSCSPKEQRDSLRRHLVCLLLIWSFLLWTIVTILPLPHPGSSAQYHFPPGSHGLHLSFLSWPPCWARFCRPRPSGLSPTSLPAIQLSSSQGLLQIHLPQRSQKSPPTRHTPCGEMWPRGYLKSASCSLHTQFGQPPPLFSSALDMTWKGPPLCSHSWFSSQIFRQGFIYSKTWAWKRKWRLRCHFKSATTGTVRFNTGFLQDLFLNPLTPTSLWPVHGL